MIDFDSYTEGRNHLIFKFSLNDNNVHAINIQHIGRNPKNCHVVGWEADYASERVEYRAQRQSRSVDILPYEQCTSPMLKPNFEFRVPDEERVHICARQDANKPTFSVAAGTALVCNNNEGQLEVAGVASYDGYWERVGGGAGPKVFTNIAHEGSDTWIRNIMHQH